jgi:hypothetical protein
MVVVQLIGEDRAREIAEPPPGFAPPGEWT